MSETEHEETSPRFSKALLGRILAVGLFVGLGTFAVVQSMNSKKTAEPQELASSEVSEDQTQPEGETKVAAASVKTAQTSKTLAGFSPNTAASLKPAIQSEKSAPPPRQTNSFATRTPGNPSQVSSSKTTKSSADRYAQIDSAIPALGSRNGFGKRQAKPRSQPGFDRIQAKTTFGDTRKFGDATNAKIDNTAKQTVDAARNLKAKAAQKTDDLLKKASNAGAAAIGSFNPTVPDFGKTDSSKSAATRFPKQTAGVLSAQKTAFGGPSNASFGTQPPQADFGGRLQSSRNSSANPSLNSAPRAFAPNQSNAALGAIEKPNAKTSGGFGPPDSQPNPFRTGQASAKPRTSPFGRQPDANRSTMQANPPVFPSRQQSVLTQPASTQLNGRATGRPLGSPLVNANTTRLSRDTPGDRSLDGLQAPALTIEKFSPREIQVNQTASFELIVKNVGRVPAEDVRVFDQVPAGTEFKGATPEPRLTQRNIQWNLGQLRPGQEKRIKYQLKPIRPGEIGSVAHVTFSTMASMRTLVTKPVLEIVHQTKPIHLIGDNVVLDVVVKNKGDGPAKNVMIQQDVPKLLEFPDGLPGANRGIEYEIGTLLPGKSRRIRLSLRAANVGKIQNVMYVSADGGLSDKHSLPLEVVAPKLLARTDGPTKRILKRNVTHTFSVANQGTAKATNVELIAKLPSGLRFVESDHQGVYNPKTHAVRWALAELARDVVAKVQLKTVPVAVGNQPIKFEAFADLKARSTAEQPLNVEHLVDVFFDIDDLVDPIEIGAETSYRMRVINQGTNAATNVQLQVDFPAGLTPTSVDGAIRHSIRGQQIIFEPINSMSPGDEITIVIHGKGQTAGDHRVVVRMQTDGRTTPVLKQETTKVYSDR